MGNSMKTACPKYIPRQGNKDKCRRCRRKKKYHKTERKIAADKSRVATNTRPLSVLQEENPEPPSSWEPTAELSTSAHALEQPVSVSTSQKHDDASSDSWGRIVDMTTRPTLESVDRQERPRAHDYRASRGYEQDSGNRMNRDTPTRTYHRESLEREPRRHTPMTDELRSASRTDRDMPTHETRPEPLDREARRRADYDTTSRADRGMPTRTYHRESLKPEPRRHTPMTDELRSASRTDRDIPARATRQESVDYEARRRGSSMHKQTSARSVGEALDLDRTIAEEDAWLGSLKVWIETEAIVIASIREAIETKLIEVRSHAKDLAELKTATIKLAENARDHGQVEQRHAQQLHIQRQMQRITRLEQRFADGKAEVESWFKVLYQMEEASKPKAVNAFDAAPADIQQRLCNPGSSTPTIHAPASESPINGAPEMQPGYPARINFSKNNGIIVRAGQPLTSTAVGPSGSVTFPIVGQPNGQGVIEPVVPKPFDISSYGTYHVTIFDETQQHKLLSTYITVVPERKICIPKKFVIKDSINNAIKGGRVTLTRKNGTIAFTGVTDDSGTIELPDTLPDDTYDVTIEPNDPQLKTMTFKMVVFGNRRPPIDNHFLGRVVGSANTMEFVLRWGPTPRDLDSHMYTSTKKHIYFAHKIDGTMSLDCDVLNGNGPETIKVNLEPGVKYVYAVHRYSKDGELTKSDATLLINGEQPEPLGTVSVPKENRPEANFWIVCVIDGTTKSIKYIHKFEEQNSCSVDEIVAKYVNV